MSEKNQDKEHNSFAFGRVNYKLLFIGLAVILIGYLLMVGGGSDDPNVFSEEIFSPRRITVAPLVLVLGYGLIIYSILKKHSDA